MSTLAGSVGAVIGLGAAGLGLAGLLGHQWTVRNAWLVPLTGLELRMDPIAGFFLLLVGAAAFPASLYALDHHRGERRGDGAYLVFLLAMGVVPLAANAPTFLLAWELMALASYALVLHDHRQPEVVRAAWIYAVMTHAGLASLLAGMLFMSASTGSLRFADWHAAGPGLDGTTRSLAWLLLTIGFASKAGVVPLHVWLPIAHPAAPSHVSALMSGVMIKLGIYGLLRVGLEWLGPGPAWWGVALLLAGTVSALKGVLYALVERDLKRLLAFSSIENVGIVLIGVGAGMVFHASGLEFLAVFAVAAGLYHTANHAAFKALLFLGAGAVTHALGTRDMEAMGGLIKRMPWTAAAFLVGAVAIAALPPLNGFVSEWLTLLALLQAAQIPRLELSLVFALAIAGLALTSGLAVACFVRAFGITFLALPRSAAAAGAHEAGGATRAALALLALACVALGLGPTVVLPVLGGAAASLVGLPAPVLVEWPLTLTVAGDFASLSVPVIALGLGLGLLLPLLALRLVGAPRGRRFAATWGCGRLLQTARMEYNATSFAGPYKRIFDFVYRPRKRLEIEFHPESRFFVRRMSYENLPRGLAEEWLYVPVVRALQHASARMRRLQSGSSNLYLIYVLAALLILLVLA